MDVTASLERAHADLVSLVPQWAQASERGIRALQNHGDWHRWHRGLRGLAEVSDANASLGDELAVEGTLVAGSCAELEDSLLELHPWRKGPVNLFGVHIDTEWRSDWKWSRLEPHIHLSGKRVLDVGCGNGYYMYRMVGAGASEVVGVDPTVVYLAQYVALRHLVGATGAPHGMVAARFEDLATPAQPFDTVFSMGVLYHRPDPMEHLHRLRNHLRAKGDLVLETLVVPDEAAPVLHPDGRYARMRNVHAIPSTDRLLEWVEEAGFREAQIVDVTPTTPREQRPTAWMHFESLAHALDPRDPTKTVEGYPAPVRAIVLATRRDES